MTEREKILGMMASFTWFWGQDFFLETEVGNFHWRDPDYGGDNTLTRFKGNLSDFQQSLKMEYGRCKGQHVIERYCGMEVVLVGLESS